VAKASLYDCFGSKDELVRSYLQGRSEARRARINERLSQYDAPEEKILSIFDLLGELAARPGFRGCAFVRAGADAVSSDKVKGVCAESRAFILGKFTDLAREAGASEPELLGKQLVLLYDGASIAAHLDGNRDAVSTARALAAQILSSDARTSGAKTKRTARHGS
jgi:AcrR family transcriptional regulator